MARYNSSRKGNGEGRNFPLKKVFTFFKKQELSLKKLPSPMCLPSLCHIKRDCGLPEQGLSWAVVRLSPVVFSLGAAEARVAFGCPQAERKIKPVGKRLQLVVQSPAPLLENWGRVRGNKSSRVEYHRRTGRWAINGKAGGKNSEAACSFPCVQMKPLPSPFLSQF